MNLIAKFINAGRLFQTIDKVYDRINKLEVKKIRDLVNKYKQNPTKLEKVSILDDLDKYSDDIKYISKFLDYANLKITASYKKVIRDALKIIE